MNQISVIVFLFVAITNLCNGFKTPEVGGYCPRGWRRIGYICYKYKHRKGNIYRALKQCKRIEVRSNIEQTIKEDFSNLLTLTKLVEFQRDYAKFSKKIKKKILLNAFKYQGKWYEIHKLPRKLKHFKLKRFIGGHENIQEVTQYDFSNMGYADAYEQGKDFSGLAYDPKTNTLKVVNSRKKYAYVCSHKRQHKPGVACFGKTHECNDRGVCLNEKCYCYSGYQGMNCNTPI